ncbi:EAL domain-containing protein [Pseudomonas sp. S31]|uniref:hypothetical protein n=1 Tax=Pseudomonas sp. S31 TaxID=1564473 RepID=UPI0019123C85|nr:hypothetical protein [Pseudomonas sp. S31]MBK4997780.1 EAL domain-containing protein [Pseudomonas sp. S31]
MTSPHSPYSDPQPAASGCLRRSFQRLLPVTFALAGIGLSLALGHLDTQRRYSEQLAQVDARLAGVRGALEAQLRAAFGEAEGIAQLITVDGAISVEHFRNMAEDALSSVSYMRTIALAPDDVVRDIFPLQGNEGLIGLDYRRLPEQSPAGVR